MFSKLTLSVFSTALVLAATVSARAQEIDGSLANALPGSLTETFSQAPLKAKSDGAKLTNKIFPRRSNSRGKSSSFVGTWVSTLSRTKNTCDPTSTPTSLTSALVIDSNLGGTDLADGSPFFTGRVLAANRIGFARSRATNGCTQTQVYIIGNISGSNGAAAIKSDTTCGAQSCSTLFVGQARKQ